MLDLAERDPRLVQPLDNPLVDQGHAQHFNGEEMGTCSRRSFHRQEPDLSQIHHCDTGLAGRHHLQVFPPRL